MGDFSYLEIFWSLEDKVEFQIENFKSKCQGFFSQDLLSLPYKQYPIPRRIDLFTESLSSTNTKHSYSKLIGQRLSQAWTASTAPLRPGSQFTNTSNQGDLICLVCHSVLPAEQVWAPSLLWWDRLPGWAMCSPKTKKAVVPCPLGGQRLLH